MLPCEEGSPLILRFHLLCNEISSDGGHIVMNTDIQILVWVQMFRFRCLAARLRYLPLKILSEVSGTPQSK